MRGVLCAIARGGKRDHEQGTRTVRGNLRTLAHPRPGARVYARGVASHAAGRRRAGTVLSRESTDAGAGYSRVHPTDPGWRRAAFTPVEIPGPPLSQTILD